jgi:hypothetical protein
LPEIRAPLSSDAWDRDGNLIVPRYGIRTALGLAFLAACAFWLFSYLGDQKWHQEHPGTGASGFSDPLWVFLLWTALPLVPFLLS